MFKLMFLPLKTVRMFLRVAGIRGVIFLGIGVVVGLLIAPTSGDRLRAKIQARIAPPAPAPAPAPAPRPAPVSTASTTQAPASA